MLVCVRGESSAASQPVVVAALVPSILETDDRTSGSLVGYVDVCAQ